MWEQISAGALYGGIGGGIGAMVGALLAYPFLKTKFATIATSALTVLGATLGYNFAEPLLKPYIGKYLPQSASQERQLDEAFEELRADPLMAAIVEKEPQLETELRAELAEIVAKHTNASETQRAAFLAAHGRVSGRFTYYLPRAQDDDLVAFVSHMVGVMNYLTSADPNFCHQFFYDPVSMAGMTAEQIKSRMGHDHHALQQKLAAAAVINAFDEIPQYDVEAAQARVNQAGQRLVELLGADRIGLISVGGAKPQSDEDAAAACDATAQMFQYLLDSEHAAGALRHIYTL